MPNRSSVREADTDNYGYDANGNMNSRLGSSIIYTSYDLPTGINAPGGYSSTIAYGAFRNRCKQIAVSASGTETTIYVGGMLEKVTRSGVTEYRHLIHGGKGVAAIYTRRTSGSLLTDTFYVHSDHLGSPELITNAAGAQVVKLSFGAYGERRDSDWVGAVTSGDMTTIGNTIRHGFTGHEHLDSVGLVHMNGRVYDPVVGRFLSADPFIDWGLGTQGVNRYGYVGNNPLSFADPSGYNCSTHPAGMNDEEAAEANSRCADEYDAAGWSADSERWCAMLDFNCQNANYSQTQASLVDALIYAGIPPPQPGTTGISDADVDNTLGDELVVTASRLRNGDEDLRWARHLGVPTSAFLTSATLPNGDQGWVVATGTSERRNVLAVAAVLSSDQLVAIRILVPLVVPAFSLGEAVGVIQVPAWLEEYRDRFGGAQVVGGGVSVYSGIVAASTAPAWVVFALVGGGTFAITRGIDDLSGGRMRGLGADAWCAFFDGC